MKKQHFLQALKKFKEEKVGAACLRDKATHQMHCASNLTEDAAIKFADDNNLQVINWQAGKTCSQMQC